MSNVNLIPPAPDLTDHVPGFWHSPATKTALQVIFLIGIGAVAALAKKISLPLGIPGHSAVLWLTPLVLGRALIRRDGAGTLMGLSLAAWGVPAGLENSFMYNLGLYGFSGLALDLAARIPKVAITGWYGAIICGALAHMVKFGYLVGAALFASTTRHFLIVGLAKSALLHLGFGAAAGLAGWLVFYFWNRGRRSESQKPSTGF